MRSPPNIGAPNVSEQIPGIQFGSFPWATHPIDYAKGWTGWGPFDGPWTPFDFPQFGRDIDITWHSGNNAWLVGPPGSGGQGAMIFPDRSQRLVANSAPAPAFQPVGQGGATISNGYPLEASSTGVAQSAKTLWTALKTRLGVQ